MQRRQSLLALGVLASVSGCAGMRERREARLPGPAQPAAQADGDDLWRDAQRGREVPIRMRWPAGSAPCPLVVYSHGLGGSREGGDVWGRAWQAAGIAVLHVQHAGSDSTVLRAGPGALLAAATAEQLLARVADMRFVVDEALRRQREGGAWARVRADAIGAAGHSFGAHTTQAVAGQRFSVAGPSLAEPRFRAFVALSPSPGRNDPAAVQQQFGAIRRPVLLATGSQDGDPLGGDKTPADRASVYDGLPPGQRALLWIDGADHMTFAGNADQRLTARRGPLARTEGAAVAEPRHHALLAQITAQWWRWRLLGDAEAEAALQAPQGVRSPDRWRLG